MKFIILIISSVITIVFGVSCDDIKYAEKIINSHSLRELEAASREVPLYAFQSKLTKKILTLSSDRGVEYLYSKCHNTDTQKSLELRNKYLALFVIIAKQNPNKYSAKIRSLLGMIIAEDDLRSLMIINDFYDYLIFYNNDFPPELLEDAEKIFYLNDLMQHMPFTNLIFYEYPIEKLEKMSHKLSNISKQNALDFTKKLKRKKDNKTYYNQVELLIQQQLDNENKTKK